MRTVGGHGETGASRRLTHPLTTSVCVRFTFVAEVADQLSSKASSRQDIHQQRGMKTVAGINIRFSQQLQTTLTAIDQTLMHNNSQRRLRRRLIRNEALPMRDGRQGVALGRQISPGILDSRTELGGRDGSCCCSEFTLGWTTSKSSPSNTGIIVPP